MKQTKDKILEKSLMLFNERGVSNVSLRNIACEMGISVGNLQYHFKKREEITIALYFQLVETIDHSMNLENISSFSGEKLNVLFGISKVMLTSFFEYRFFFLDFNAIVNQHPTIKTHYKGLMQKREQQFFAFITDLIEADLMRKEVLPNEYKNLFLRIQVLSDFWMSSATVQSKKISKKLMLEYLEVIDQTVFPYLTEAGKMQYLKLAKH